MNSTAIAAALLSPSWGLYAGYELYEHVARPGAEDGPGGVREEVHLLQAQVGAQRFHVLDEAVSPQGRRIHRVGGGSDACTTSNPSGMVVHTLIGSVVSRRRRAARSIRHLVR